MVVLLFGLAYAASNKGTKKIILVYISINSVVLQKIVKFKDFSRPCSDSPVLFKADLVLKDFSKKPSKFNRALDKLVYHVNYENI